MRKEVLPYIFIVWLLGQNTRHPQLKEKFILVNFSVHSWLALRQVSVAGEHVRGTLLMAGDHEAETRGRTLGGR